MAAPGAPGHEGVLVKMRTVAPVPPGDIATAKTVDPAFPALASPVGPSHAPVAGCVLVVDDQATQRFVTTAVLGEMASASGFHVLDAADGPAALEALASLPDGPVLVLSDALMPGMGGLELARVARARFPDRPLRFVLFTAHDAGQYADAVGTDLADVVTKPVGIDGLRSVLGAQVAAWRAAAPNGLKTGP